MDGKQTYSQLDERSDSGGAARVESRRRFWPMPTATTDRLADLLLRININKGNE